MSAADTPNGDPRREAQASSQTPAQEGALQEHELRLLDGLLGQLPVGEQETLDAALAQDLLSDDRRLNREQAGVAALLAAEQMAFDPQADPAWDSARASARVTAWVRDQARRQARTDEAASRNRERAAEAASAAGRRTGWARVLAWSVGLHVLLLGLVAFALREDAPREETRGARIALAEDLGFLDEDTDALDAEFARAYPHLEWRDVARISDELVLREQETYTEELPGAFEDAALEAGELASGGGGAEHRRGLFDQPVGVVAATVRRTDPALKRRRLDLLGFNADGTLRAVEKGLTYLAPRQAEDGSWPGAGTRSDLEQTAVALLAFLGDGNSSKSASKNTSEAPSSRKERGVVVAKGVHWLREQLFNASQSDAERAAHLATHDVSVLGPATVALCEDYMLSYGWLSPDAAERRAREISELAVRLQDRAATPAADPVEHPWAVWGLDAAARIGVVANTDTNLRAFRRWVESASGATPTVSAMSFLSVGTALLYAERGAEKPRFLQWSKANAKQLAAKLGRHGYVRSEDPIGDTALVLLGLQVAYRTY